MKQVYNIHILQRLPRERDTLWTWGVAPGWGAGCSGGVGEEAPAQTGRVPSQRGTTRRRLPAAQRGDNCVVSHGGSARGGKRRHLPASESHADAEGSGVLIAASSAEEEEEEESRGCQREGGGAARGTSGPVPSSRSCCGNRNRPRTGAKRRLQDNRARQPRAGGIWGYCVFPVPAPTGGSCKHKTFNIFLELLHESSSICCTLGNGRSHLKPLPISHGASRCRKRRENASRRA